MKVAAGVAYATTGGDGASYAQRRIHQGMGRVVGEQGGWKRRRRRRENRGRKWVDFKHKKQSW